MENGDPPAIPILFYMLIDLGKLILREIQYVLTEPRIEFLFDPRHVVTHRADSCSSSFKAQIQREIQKEYIQYSGRPVFSFSFLAKVLFPAPGLPITIIRFISSKAIKVFLDVL